MKRKISCLLLLLTILNSMIAIPNSAYAQESSIANSYKNIIVKHRTNTTSFETSTGEAITHITYSKYALYDIDKDDVPELIVDDANDSMLYVYTFKNGTITEWWGYVDAYNSDSFFEYPNGNGIIVYGGGVGNDHLESVFKYVFINEELSFDEVIASGYTLDGSVKELRDSLSGYKKITFKDTNDLALLDNLQNPIKVILNGTEIEFDQPPIMISNRVMVPMRKIFESLGATVEWDCNTRTATAVRENTFVKIAIDSDMLSITGIKIQDILLDFPAKLVNNRTYVPVRAVSEAFDTVVSWNGKERVVYIDVLQK